jgi:hypothetical protein
MLDCDELYYTHQGLKLGEGAVVGAGAVKLAKMLKTI